MTEETKKQTTPNTPPQDIKVEEVKSETSVPTEKKATDNVSEIPPLENPDVPLRAESVSGTKQESTSKQSKDERKSRKAVQKLGLKPVNGITKVTLRKGKNVCVIPHSQHTHTHTTQYH
jgi:nascent polypeptide-associated complex subunit alpha